MALWGLRGQDPVEQAYQCVKAGVENTSRSRSIK